MRMTYKIKRAIEDALDGAGAVDEASGLYRFPDGVDDDSLADHIKSENAGLVIGIEGITGRDVGSVRRLMFGRVVGRVLAQPDPPACATAAEVADLRGVARVQAAEIRELRRLIDWMAEAWCGFSGNRAPTL